MICRPLSGGKYVIELAVPLQILSIQSLNTGNVVLFQNVFKWLQLFQFIRDIKEL